MHTSPRRSSSSTSSGAPSWSTSWPRSSRPCGRAATAPARSVADERYRAHRAVRGLLELLAREQPLVVVLDDLHWSDDASIELLAALLRREPDAPVLLALGFRPGQAPAGSRRRSRCLRRGGSRSSRSTRRRRPQLLGDARAAGGRGDLSPRAAATRSTSSSSGARGRTDASRPRSTARATDVAVAGVPVPAAVAASLAEELASLPADELTLLRAAAVAGEPFEPDLAAAIAELPRGDGARAPSTRCSRSTSCARRRCRAASSSATRSCAGRSTRRRRPVGGSRPTRGRPRRWPRGAPPRPSAPTTSSSTQARATRRRSRSCSRPETAAAARAPAAAARWFEAALRLLPASDERQVDVRVALASSLRSLGELDRCGATLLDAIELLPADAVARRVELTAQCAAVEHWLGRHDEAHRRLTRAWEDLPDRSTAEAAVLEIELAVDGLYERDFEQAVEMGRQALATARGRRRPGAASRPPRRSLCLAETVAGRDRRGPRAPSRRRWPRSTGSRTPSSRRASRRSTTSPGPRPTSSSTTTRSPTSSEAIAIAQGVRRGPAARAAAARQELPLRDAGPAARGDRALRDGARGGPAVREPARALPRPLRARLDAVLRRRPRRRDRGPRGELARRPEAGRRHDPERRRRAGLGARRRAGSRRARSSAAASCCSSSSARTGRARCPSSAASTGRA